MTQRPSLDDYIDVAERIAHFKEEHPDGTLQTISWDVREVGGKTFVIYRAAAYRTPDDERPGHGTAWEPFPGPTPYTRDSELMNAETAAWGRAIVAVGLAANRKIASRQEVQARQDDARPAQQAGRPQRSGKPTDKQVKYLKTLVTKSGAKAGTLRAMLDDAGAPDIPVAEGWLDRLNSGQVSALIERFKEGVLPDPDAPADIPSDIEPPEPVGDDSDLPFATRDAA